MNPFVKLGLELGPLLLFFFANARYGLIPATAAFMVATAIALPIAYMLEKRLPIMPLITGAFVLVFGGLTVWLQDETFIKLKPTIVNLLFAAILLGGMVARQSLLKPLLGTMMRLTDEGWRLLTLRWGAFFIVLALLNEIVWRTQSTDFWVNFKVFGIMPLTIAFSIAQMPLINRHQADSEQS